MEAVDGALLGHLDNQSALALVHGQAGSWRKRHLRLRVHWLGERIPNGEVQVIHESGATPRERTWEQSPSPGKGSVS